jgi:hypothetical protein
MALPAHSGLRPLIQFRNLFSQTVGLLGRVISPSQGRYLKTGQHTHIPKTHALSSIQTHDPSVRASEDSSCLRPRGYCGRLLSRLRSCIPNDIVPARLHAKIWYQFLLYSHTLHPPLILSLI